MWTSLPSFYDALAGLWTDKWFHYIKPVDSSGEESRSFHPHALMLPTSADVYSWKDVPYIKNDAKLNPKHMLVRVIGPVVLTAL